MVLRPVLAVLLLALLTACGGGSGREDTGSTSPDAAFAPVTFEHAFGTTTISARPQRVVALGVTDADPLLALGVTPVATAGYPFYEGGLGPWARNRVQGEAPASIESDSTPNVEQIAALRPDLVVALSSGIDQAAYDRLSRLAPVLARPEGTPAYTVLRADAMTTVARALGMAAAGERLNAETQALIDRARAANPSFVGATGAVVLPYQGRYGAFTRGDAREQLIGELGVVPPPGLAALGTPDSFFRELSREQVGLLDGDLLVMIASEAEQREAVEGDAVLQNLGVARRGGLVLADLDLRGALTYNSVLSVPFALERLVPALQGALRAPSASATPGLR